MAKPPARGYKLVNKRPNRVKIGEITYPKKTGRFKGVSVGRRIDGYFVCTHRASSKSYEKPSHIPNHVIKQIESTG
jgi:hypothetical protein